MTSSVAMRRGYTPSICTAAYGRGVPEVILFQMWEIQYSSMLLYTAQRPLRYHGRATCPDREGCRGIVRAPMRYIRHGRQVNWSNDNKRGRLLVVFGLHMVESQTCQPMTVRIWSLVAISIQQDETAESLGSGRSYASQTALAGSVPSLDDACRFSSVVYANGDVLTG
ncbi:hypothetical protein LY76DRAFT_592355 [Colletotrichum caudatum]|nr:hypothetical protein LY76DRAFT_592355 [Colletotrichum caudatum]